MTVAPRQPQIAATVGLGFGGLWSYAGAQGLPPPLRTPASALGVLVTLVLVGLLWANRSPASGAPLFRRRAYLVAVGLEVAGIYAATLLLARLGLTDFLVPAVGAIVGLHFIGLWRAAGERRFLWITGAMCLISAVAVVLPAAWMTGLGEASPRQAATGFGDALVLWVFAGRSWRRPQGDR